MTEPTKHSYGFMVIGGSPDLIIPGVVSDNPPYPEIQQNPYSAEGSSDENCIIVICAEDADPKYNKLQLKTDPPTYIELQPGKNVLSVKKYPALKYGFTQIDDYVNAGPYEYNGGNT